MNRKSKVMNIILWLAQGLLAIGLIMGFYLKLFSEPSKLAEMWPWTIGNEMLVKITGIIDLIAAIGLIFPMLLKIKPNLTIYAAYGIILLMIVAIIFHVSRGETSVTGVNVVYILLAGFIIWGRK